MKIFKRRKHPTGKSSRQRAFTLFGEGQRPAQVCKTVPVSLRTACRYFESYKKLHNKVSYSQIRKWMKGSPEFSEKVIGLLATSLDMSREEVVTRMQKPWGLIQAMKGEWPNYRLDKEQTAVEDRLLAALTIIDFIDRFGQKDPGKVREVLRHLIMTDSEEEGGKTQ